MQLQGEYGFLGGLVIAGDWFIGVLLIAVVTLSPHFLIPPSNYTTQDRPLSEHQLGRLD